MSDKELEDLINQTRKEFNRMLHVLIDNKNKRCNKLRKNKVTTYYEDVMNDVQETEEQEQERAYLERMWDLIE